MTKLPAPEQWALVPMTEIECAEMIEGMIDYVDEDGRSVHYPTQFVRHYLTRKDSPLFKAVAIATSPIILADGGVLASTEQFGLDRERGIKFIIPKEVMDIMPKREDCTPEAVGKAMQFLTDEWLCDVAASYAGKCTLIASALTIMERTLLPDRPVFWVTAGRRGVGKTIALIMLIVAVTGIRPAASAWSKSEEERRKALFSYLLHGAAYIIWDNIERGSQISCPHVELSCTTKYYADRRLGVSEAVAIAASLIHFFTGNNVGPRGDLASRSLITRLETDRTDPQNRMFQHPDPIGWTEDHRAEIMQAFYTILLGNPTLKEPRDAQMKTRFKMWWRLVGSAIENAAKAAGHDVDFQQLFVEVDAGDEDETTLAEILDAIKATSITGIDGKFKATDICRFLSADEQSGKQYHDMLQDFFNPQYAKGVAASAKTVGRILKLNVDNPVRANDRTLILKRRKNRDDVFEYEVLIKRDADPALSPEHADTHS